MAPKYSYVVTKKNGQTFEKKYRVDADFVPSEIAEIHMDFIENYCVANNKIDWLLEEVNTSEYTTEKKNKETGEKETKTVKCDNYPFVMLRADFAKKFFPSIIKGIEKKETVKDRLNKKYGRK